MEIMGVVAVVALVIGLAFIFSEVRRARVLLETKLAELTQMVTFTTRAELRPISVGPITVVVEMKKPERTTRRPRTATLPNIVTPAAMAGGAHATT